MKTALVIIDIQQDYFEGGRNPLFGADKAALNAKIVLEKFRSKTLPIVHIQHISTRKEATFFLPDTAGVDIHPIVAPLFNEKVIVKHFPNSFRETELLNYLQSLEITDLVICGMMTHNCVDSTTRAAKDLGFNVKVIGDACATKNMEWNGETVAAEQVQTAFLAALNFFFASVITTNQYITTN